MRNSAMMMAALLTTLLTSATCYAHKINLFAVVEGQTIRGEAYFRGQAPVQAAAVRIYAPDGGLLFEGKTDAEGKFSYQTQRRCDHKLVVDLGDGHSESYTVRSEELPPQLPAGPTAAPTAPKAAASAAPDGHEAASSGLAAQVAQLRREVQEMRNEIRLRDVLGGIGYILGLMGLSFYFLGVRRGAKPH